jgi:hypothetical protein
MACSKLAKGGFMKFRSALTKSNDTIALKMTIAFGSIWCVYAFTVFSLVPLLAPSLQDKLLYISNCIQLIALPALMVGSAILARSSDQRARNDHEALREILKDVHEELAILKQMMPGVAQESDTERQGASRVPVP